LDSANQLVFISCMARTPTNMILTGAQGWVFSVALTNFFMDPSAIQRFSFGGSTIGACLPYTYESGRTSLFLGSAQGGLYDVRVRNRLLRWMYLTFPFQLSWMPLHSLCGALILLFGKYLLLLVPDIPSTACKFVRIANIQFLLIIHPYPFVVVAPGRGNIALSSALVQFLHVELTEDGPLVLKDLQNAQSGWTTYLRFGTINSNGLPVFFGIDTASSGSNPRSSILEPIDACMPPSHALLSIY